MTVPSAKDARLLGDQLQQDPVKYANNVPDLLKCLDAPIQEVRGPYAVLSFHSSCPTATAAYVQPMIDSRTAVLRIVACCARNLHTRPTTGSFPAHCKPSSVLPHGGCAVISAGGPR